MRYMLHIPIYGICSILVYRYTTIYSICCIYRYTVYAVYSYTDIRPQTALRSVHRQAHAQSGLAGPQKGSARQRLRLNGLLRHSFEAQAPKAALCSGRPRHRAARRLRLDGPTRPLCALAGRARDMAGTRTELTELCALCFTRGKSRSGCDAHSSAHSKSCTRGGIPIRDHVWSRCLVAVCARCLASTLCARTLCVLAVWSRCVAMQYYVCFTHGRSCTPSLIRFLEYKYMTPPH